MMLKSVGLKVTQEDSIDRKEKRKTTLAEPLGAPMVRSLEEKKKREKMGSPCCTSDMRENKMRDCGVTEAKQLLEGGGKERLYIMLLKIYVN